MDQRRDAVDWKIFLLLVIVKARKCLTGNITVVALTSSKAAYLTYAYQTIARHILLWLDIIVGFTST